LMDLSGTWVDSPVATLLHEKMDEFGIQTQAFSSAWSFGFEIGPESGRIATLESANGKSQFRGRVAPLGNPLFKTPRLSRG
jgi:hypothetical protein